MFSDTARTLARRASRRAARAGMRAETQWMTGMAVASRPPAAVTTRWAEACETPARNWTMTLTWRLGWCAATRASAGSAAPAGAAEASPRRRQPATTIQRMRQRMGTKREAADIFRATPGRSSLRPWSETGTEPVAERSARDLWLCVPVSRRVCPEAASHSASGAPGRALIGAGRLSPTASPAVGMSFKDSRRRPMTESMARVQTAPRPPLIRPWLRKFSAVWALNAFIAAAAALLYVLHARDLGPIAEPHLPVWALILAFIAGERAVVHLPFRRSAHSFSFGDVPLVLGLLFASTPQLVLAALVGTAVPLVLDRQLPVIKTVFNLAQMALATCVAAPVLHLVTGPADDIGPVVWIGVLAAVEASAILTVGLIGLAIRLSEGRLPHGMARDMVTRDLAVTVTNTSLALAASVLIAVDARSLPLLVVPAMTVFLAYRAYIVERQRHERLEFLYEATRTLARSPEIILALEALLTRSLDAFRVEMAEIVLISADGQPPLRTWLSANGEKEAMTPVERGIADDLIELVETEGPVVALEAPFGSSRVRAYMEERGVTHAMLAVLRNNDRIVGTLMLANRPGIVNRFDDEDLRLFEALANNTSVALQFDRLEQSIWQMRELQEQLQHQAFHDPLTDLANRSLFNNQVKDALAQNVGPIAVLFVDVDDFKAVNDTLGHSVGDEVLMMIAERLRACILP